MWGHHCVCRWDDVRTSLCTSLGWCEDITVYVVGMMWGHHCVSRWDDVRTLCACCSRLLLIFSGTLSGNPTARSDILSAVQTLWHHCLVWQGLNYAAPTDVWNKNYEMYHKYQVIVIQTWKTIIYFLWINITIVTRMSITFWIIHFHSIDCIMMKK